MDPSEHFLLMNYDIRYFSTRDIDWLNIQKVMEQTFGLLLGKKQRPIHLSFDIDEFDPALALATGTLIVGGLAYWEGMYITGNIQYRVASMLDFVGVILQLALQRSQGYSWPSSGCDCFKFWSDEGGRAQRLWPAAYSQFTTRIRKWRTCENLARAVCWHTFVTLGVPELCGVWGDRYYMVIWVNTALMRTFAYSRNCKVSSSISVTNNYTVNIFDLLQFTRY